MQIAVRMAALLFAAMVTENIVFGRAIGVTVPEKQRPQDILKTGGILAIVIALSSFFASLIAGAITADKRVYLEPIIYTTLISVIFLVIYFGTKSIGNKKGIDTDVFCKRLATATFNGAVFGAVLIVTRRLYTPLDAVFYGIGGAIGYTIAMLFIRRQRHQAKMLRVPNAFKGLPITLIYIGIISLALYGLIGHQLTA